MNQGIRPLIKPSHVTICQCTSTKRLSVYDKSHF